MVVIFSECGSRVMAPQGPTYIYYSGFRGSDSPFNLCLVTGFTGPGAGDTGGGALF